MAQQPNESFIYRNSLRPPAQNNWNTPKEIVEPNLLKFGSNNQKKNDKVYEPINYDKVDTGKITPQKQKPFLNGGYNHELLYDGGSLRLRTPPLLALFGISSYKYSEDTPTYYSINLGIPEEVTPEFMKIMSQVDFICDQSKNIGDKYMSFIKGPRAGKSGLQHLRIKLRSKPIRGQPDPGDNTKLMLTVLLSGVNGGRKLLNDPTVEELKKYLKHNTKCSAIIRLCSYWRNCNGLCGCSWDTNKIELF